MRKIRTAWILFFAVLALVAIPAADASAAPEWYKNGVKLAAAQSAFANGSWTLEGLGIFGIKLRIECSVKWVGTVGPGGADEVKTVTDLGGKSLLDCTILEKALCENTTAELALVTAEKLPWTSQLEQSGTNVVDNLTSGALDVRCLLSGGTWPLELCEQMPKTDPLVNQANGTVSAKILENSSTKCNSSSNVMHLSASVSIGLLNGETLEVK